MQQVHLKLLLLLVFQYLALQEFLINLILAIIKALQVHLMLVTLLLLALLVRMVVDILNHLVGDLLAHLVEDLLAQLVGDLLANLVGDLLAHLVGDLLARLVDLLDPLLVAHRHKEFLSVQNLHHYVTPTLIS